jgi:hypothetical protein
MIRYEQRKHASALSDLTSVMDSSCFDTEKKETKQTLTSVMTNERTNERALTSVMTI